MKSSKHNFTTALIPQPLFLFILFIYLIIYFLTISWKSWNLCMTRRKERREKPQLKESQFADPKMAFLLRFLKESHYKSVASNLC